MRLICRLCCQVKVNDINMSKFFNIHILDVVHNHTKYDLRCMIKDIRQPENGA